MIKKLIKNQDGKYVWVESDSLSKKWEGKDQNGMTIDQLISRDGAILNHADGKNYFSKRSYLEAIKASGCYIKE